MSTCCKLRMAYSYRLYGRRDTSANGYSYGCNNEVCRVCRATAQRLQIEKSLSVGNLTCNKESQQDLHADTSVFVPSVATLCKNKLDLYRAEKELDLYRSKSRSFSMDRLSAGSCDNNFSIAHEKELKNLGAQMADIQRQREAALREVAELKVQLKMAEETRDTIRRDLIEANRKIREGIFL